MEEIKAAIFDLDGTLVDTESLSDKAVLFSLKEFLPQNVWEDRAAAGYQLPWDAKKQILGLRGSEWAPKIIQYAVEHWGVSKDNAPSVEDVWNSWERHLNSFCGEVQACVGAAELVERFAGLDVPMAIATSSRLAAVSEKSKNHVAMFSKIKEIVAGDDPAVKNGKPAPDIYLEAARRLGVDPKNCVVFEDALSGAKAGKEAGCFVVAVPDNRFGPEERASFFQVSDIVIDNLSQFDGSQVGLQWYAN